MIYKYNLSVSFISLKIPLNTILLITIIVLSTGVNANKIFAKVQGISLFAKIIPVNTKLSN